LKSEELNVQKKDERSMADMMLNPSKHGLRIVFEFGLLFSVVHFAAHPEGAAILLIEYLKLPPELTISIVSAGVPLLVAMTVARMLTGLWFIAISPLILIVGSIFILILTSPLWLASKFGFERFEKVTTKALGKFADVLMAVVKKGGNTIGGPVHGIYLTNAFIFFGLLATFYVFIAGDNSLSKHWGSKNPRLIMTSNLHYYCQVTGSYNKAECDEWLKKRGESR
jgi:hypothetical protein